MPKVSLAAATPRRLAADATAPAEEAQPLPVCPHFHHAVELIGARWSGAILRAMLLGCHRFAEIRSAVPGLSDTMLSQRLRELEAAGVVRREVHPTIPVRVDYHLTDAGRDLEPVLDAIVTWAHCWVEPTGAVDPTWSVDR